VQTQFPASTLRGVDRPRRLREWCEARELDEPSKIDVANRVLDLRHEFPSLLNVKGRRMLVDLHRRISAIFEGDNTSGQLLDGHKRDAVPSVNSQAK
jgi:hypothetical protein